MSYHLVQNKIMKFLRSPEVNYNFNKVTGYLERWGRTKEEDPVYAPFPEILDIEVTSICAGPDNKNCSFCSPAGTIVNTPNGDVDIKNIKVGDVVWSATSLGTQKPRMRHNVVEEVYTREYDGELICIELENGKVLKLTPEHPVMVKGGIEVLAGELTVDHEIIHMDDNVVSFTITKEQFSGAVYNFHCTPDEMYMSEGILVHNCYKANTTNGYNMPLEDFKNIIDKMPFLTQVALGADAHGTTNPHLFDMMAYARSKEVIPNLTIADRSSESAKQNSFDLGLANAERVVIRRKRI